MTTAPFEIKDAHDSGRKDTRAHDSHLYAASDPSDPHHHSILMRAMHAGNHLADAAAHSMLHGFSIHDSSKNTDHAAKIANADAAAGRVAGMSNPTIGDINELNAHASLGGSVIPGGDRHALGYAEARVQAAMATAQGKLAELQRKEQERLDALKNPKMTEFKQKTNIADGNHWGNDTERLYKNAMQQPPEELRPAPAA